MNEKGIFNIFGLLLLLIIALNVKFAQTFEKNYSYEATNFQAETELQNAADSALVESLDYANNLPASPFPQYNQKKIFTKILDSKFKENVKISVEVWAVHGDVHKYKRNYSSADDYIDVKDEDKPGKLFISVASCDDEITGEKIFARSLAYTLDDEKNILHFMNTAERGNLKTN